MPYFPLSFMTALNEFEKRVSWITSILLPCQLEETESLHDVEERLIDRSRCGKVGSPNCLHE
jgi:hypothetical protein